jgi:hypothetical protein
MKKLCSFNSKIMVLALFLFIFFVSVSPVLATTWAVDDDGTATSTNCSAATACNSTIQDAINVASAGDTVIVCPGTYVENVVVNVTNLTVKSASGAASTIVTGASAADSTHIFHVTATGVTIGGLGYGFTIIGNATSFGTCIAAEGSYGNGLKVYDNIFRIHAAGESQGIWIGTASNGAEIKHNRFYGDNEWLNNSVEGAPGTGVIVSGATGASSLTIQNNTCYYIKYACLTLHDDSGSVTYDGVVISNNSFHNNRPDSTSGRTDNQELIRIGGAGTTTVQNTYGGINITNNSLYNAGYGIRIRAALARADYIRINYNNIYNINDTYYGIKSEIADSKTADVINNWWGDASGPTNTTTNVYGEGANVSAYLNFTPWLLTTFASAHVSSFDYMLGLNTSWNLVSMPRILTNSTIDNVAADLDVTNDIQIIYYYNGTTWLVWQADGADTLTTVEPRKGYWMKCGSKTAFGVKGSYKTSDQPPYTSLAYTPLDLTVGWHTVGFYNEDGSSGLDTDDALSTLCDGTCSVGVANFDVLAFYNVSTATTTRLLKSQYDGTNVWTQGRGFLIYMNTADTYR